MEIAEGAILRAGGWERHDDAHIFVAEAAALVASAAPGGGALQVTDNLPLHLAIRRGVSSSPEVNRMLNDTCGSPLGDVSDPPFRSCCACDFRQD